MRNLDKNTPQIDRKLALTPKLVRNYKPNKARMLVALRRLLAESAQTPKKELHVGQKLH